MNFYSRDEDNSLGAKKILALHGARTGKDEVGEMVVICYVLDSPRGRLTHEEVVHAWS